MLENSKQYDSTERTGVSLVQYIVSKELGWIFREQFVSDMGVDAHLELVIRGIPTGLLVGAQIKSWRKSNFKETPDSFIYRGSMKHYHYWINHSLPVILIADINDENTTCWVHVTEEKIKKFKKTWTIEIPKRNLFNTSAKRALSLVFAGTDSQKRLRQLSLDAPLIEHLSAGGKLSVELEDWIQKSTPRSNVTIFVKDSKGQEISQQKFFLYHEEKNIVSLARTLFPWADSGLDRTFYIDYFYPGSEYEECYMELHEDGEENIEEILLSSSNIIPYRNVLNEVDLYRFNLSLNELGASSLKVFAYVGGGV
ncbi:DUF4365 domain-containing protein [Pseudomonas frederiksbergensis]|uniref:DUF4365 domain-containing protein n=1 Tax=Pseudomonas frederiksbergensis TaxID=104087 RepID=UPI003D21134A